MSVQHSKIVASWEQILRLVFPDPQGPYYSESEYEDWGLEAAESVQLLHGQAWWTVTDDQVEAVLSIYVLFLPEDSLAYYLPAFALYTLKELVSNQDRVAIAVHLWGYFGNPAFPFLKYAASHLSREQVLTIYTCLDSLRLFHDSFNSLSHDMTWWDPMLKGLHNVALEASS